MRKFVTVKEFCKMKKRHEETIRSNIRKGNIFAIKPLGRWCVYVGDDLKNGLED